MPSPFPGMDPYLEDPTVWEEFHHIFITECMYQLVDRLGRGYIAKINERVELLSADDEAVKQYLPDVSPAEDSATATSVPGAGGTLVADGVAMTSAESVEVREGYIEIRRVPDHDLIAVVEVLSPVNKFGDGVGDYRAKRASLVRGGVHVVEIDLLMKGRRTTLSKPLPPGDYFAFVFRGDRRPVVYVHPWRLRDPLPTIPIPLRSPDPDVPLDLAAIVTTAYDRGRYERKLRYGAPIPAPLSPPDVEWAQGVLDAAGRQ